MGEDGKKLSLKRSTIILIYIKKYLIYLTKDGILLLLEVEFMDISYNKLWKMLIDKNINKTQLKDRAGVSTNAIAKLGRNEAVSMDTLEKICVALKCNRGDVMEFVDAEQENK